MTRKLLYAAACLALCTLPAAAQSASHTGPNSGTGVSGQPGNKNGPAAQGANDADNSGSKTDSTVRNQDASKIPGKPGGKSGPAVKPPKSQ